MGGTSLGIEARIGWIELDGLIDLFDGKVIRACELERGRSQDELVAILAFGRFLPDFPERLAWWNATGRKDLRCHWICRLGRFRTYTQDDQLCRQDECQPLKLEIYSENANDENVMTASWSRQMLQDIHNRVSRLLYLMR